MAREGRCPDSAHLRPKALLWFVALIFAGAIGGYGLHMILGQPPIGVCRLVSSGSLSEAALCESWTRDASTSWALTFKGNVVLWKGERGRTSFCAEFHAVSFAGELKSELECQERIQNMTTDPLDYENCVLDIARGTCYLESLCQQESKSKNGVIAWLFVIAGGLAVLFSAFSLVVEILCPKSEPDATAGTDASPDEVRFPVDKEPSEDVATRTPSVSEHAEDVSCGGSHSEPETSL